LFLDLRLLSGDSGAGKQVVRTWDVGLRRVTPIQSRLILCSIIQDQHQSIEVEEAEEVEDLPGLVGFVLSTALARMALHLHPTILAGLG
jgi:hypothetical protein